MFAPVSDAEYEQARAQAAAAAIENGADRRLPAEVAARVWSLRHGSAALPPPNRVELERDRDLVATNSLAAWERMKREARCARAHWRQARLAPLSAAWLYWSGRAIEAEGLALDSLRRWRDARRMLNYLNARLGKVDGGATCAHDIGDGRVNRPCQAIGRNWK